MRFGHLAVLMLCLIIGPIAAGCSDDDGTTTPDPASSLSYQGHENDTDSNNLVAVYPATYGTRLDDCQTCHTGGTVIDDDERESDLNPCSYCHLIPYPDDSIVSGAPEGYEGTLNSFGLDYKNNGRDKEALNDIDVTDSDNDSFSNGAEIAAGRYPGDATSKPGQPFAPADTLDLDELKALLRHNQFLLLNSHKQEFDQYVYYTGVTIKNILLAVGAADTSATSVTFIAPDGYAKDFDLDKIEEMYPPGLYFGNLDTGTLTQPGEGFVQYPPAEYIPDVSPEGGVIPDETWLMVAYGRDGADLETGYLDHTTGRLEGEGPFRSVVPQGIPGSPDRGSKYPTDYDDGWDYDDNKDHNAGLCIRGLVAIRINPMPEGYEEFDWKNGGWSLMERKQLLIYGAGIIR